MYARRRSVRAPLYRITERSRGGRIADAEVYIIPDPSPTRLRPAAIPRTPPSPRRKEHAVLSEVSLRRDRHELAHVKHRTSDHSMPPLSRAIMSRRMRCPNVRRGRHSDREKDQSDCDAA